MRPPSPLLRAKQLFALRHNLHDYRSPLSGRFVVFSQSRSGSSLLAELLDHHPEIDCAAEIYRLGPAFPHAYRHAEERVSEAPVFGFKLQVHHLDNELRLRPAEIERFIERLAAERYKFIYLKRENSLRQVVSDLLRRAGGPTYLRSNEASTVTRLRVDVDKVMKRLEVRGNYWQLAERLLEPTEHIDLSYETDLQEQSAQQPTLDRVFAFLGLPSAAVATTMRRINAKPLSDLIDNYEELQAALTATPWQDQLAERQVT